MTPAVYVEAAARGARARSRSRARDAPVEAIAGRCGFGTVETMRRAFRRRLGVSPADYREPLPLGRQRTDERSSRMKIAIPLFDRFTALDAIGPYEVLSRLPGAEIRFVAAEAGPGAHRQRHARACIADARARRTCPTRTSWSSRAATARAR